MKRILFLLLLTVSVYGQNPSRFAKIQITGNANSATATKVNVQEANGEVNTKTINSAFNKNFGLNTGDVVGANTLLNQYSTTPIEWTATAFYSGQVVFYAGKQWIANMDTVAGDVPAVSSKWEEITFDALAKKTTTVDQTIIDGSTNAVAGNAVFDGLATKSNIGHTHVASQITDLSKASVGLGNVDNTSDLSKPLSTATINALATKAPISSVHNPVTLGTANGLILSTQQLSLGLASSGVTGALSGTDWNTFNNKQDDLGFTPVRSIVGTANQVIVTPVGGVNTLSLPQSISATSAPAFGGLTIPYAIFANGTRSYSIENVGSSVALTDVTGGAVRWIVNSSGVMDFKQIPTAPTAPAGTNTTQVATTAFVQAAARPYKVYTALLSQTGTNAPTAIVLENTTGETPMLSRVGIGNYQISLTVPQTKTFVTSTAANNNYINAIGVNGLGTAVNIYTSFPASSGGSSPQDSLLNKTPIEIRIYP